MLLNAYGQSSWVYACVSTLAETVSSIPFRLMSRDSGASASERASLASGAHQLSTLSGSSASASGRSTLNPQHFRCGRDLHTVQRPEGPSESCERANQIATLFEHPHPQLDRFQFWELLVVWLCLRGEAFLLPSDADRSTISHQPSTLSILNPDHLQEIVQHGELRGWRHLSAPSTLNSQPLTGSIILPEELIHIRLPNPFNFWRGLSPLTVAWLAAQTDYAAGQFMKGTMLNNADTGVIVTTEQQATSEQKEEILALLRDRKRRAGTPDVPVFLYGGVKIEKPSISAVDLQFLENRKWNRQEICAIFKVPQELLGYTEDANRSVAESARLNFMENRVAPLCRRLEAAFQPLIDRYPQPSTPNQRRVVGRFDVESTPIMQAAQRARIDSGAKLFAMGVPLNAINDKLNLGLPELTHGDTGYLPQNLVPVGTATLNSDTL